MESGLEDRNNARTSEELTEEENLVSMESGLEDRNNLGALGAGAAVNMVSQWSPA